MNIIYIFLFLIISSYIIFMRITHKLKLEQHKTSIRLYDHLD
jgi:hypothetical protein